MMIQNSDAGGEKKKTIETSRFGGLNGSLIFSVFKLDFDAVVG